jgi:hypothetical protein
MHARALVAPALDQRGVALPLALLSLLILSVLVIGFLTLSSTEPSIASNHLMVTQARALAEAGIERAIWALNNFDDPNGIPKPQLTFTAPYDGSQLVAVSVGGVNLGGFRVTLAAGASPYERVLTAVGWVPGDSAPGPKAHQTILVTVTNPYLVFKEPPAAVSVRGTLDIGGNTLIDSRDDQSCGKKMGTLSVDETALHGNAADVWGATDNNNEDNQVTDAGDGPIPENSGDIVKQVNTETFDQYILSDADIDALRAYAKAHGTYLQGAVTFNADNKIPDGVVFVDTTTGQNITQEGVTPATPSSEFASVTIHGNAMNGEFFSGTLFVNGGLTISGNFRMHGLIYIQNDFTYHGIGESQIDGAIFSRNIRDTSPITIDSNTDGNSKVYYNCEYSKNGGGTIPYRWTIKPGSYKEISG